APASLVCTITPERYIGYFKELMTLRPGPSGMLDPNDVLVAVGLAQSAVSAPVAARRCAARTRRTANGCAKTGGRSDAPPTLLSASRLKALPPHRQATRPTSIPRLGAL